MARHLSWLRAWVMNLSLWAPVLALWAPVPGMPTQQADGVGPAASIVELQSYRRESRGMLRLRDGRTEAVRFIDLNPTVGAWYLLSIDVQSGGPRTFHLESPQRERWRLAEGQSSDIRLSRSLGPPCTLWTAEGVPPLEAAAESGLPYAPLCGGALYLRNPVAGHRTSLESVTDFLRSHVWGGEQVISFVKEEFYRDHFLERAEPGRGSDNARTLGAAGPVAAAVSRERADAAIFPQRLALDVGPARLGLLPGRWYPVVGLEGVAASVLAPEDLDQAFLRHEPHVSTLDAIESGALVYLVAFDLEQFDLHFVLGTEHPRVDWSERSPEEVRDPRLPGPDGIGSIAPLVTTGMISPADTARTIAAFAGGFKRLHGAFHRGPLALQNHGSHYGFIEQGVLFSRLQPGLATVLVMADGSVELKTWAGADEPDLPRVWYARQNGVPLIEYDASHAAGVPGVWVDQWGPGNWSGSAEEVLRTLRAGLCLQSTGTRRYLLYAYFSSATPSAMARVFQAYGCRYAMHLDMNALEHTYLALYVSQGSQLLVEHLVQGMEEVDRMSHSVLAPRFLAFPDDRDFFYLTRKEPRP